LLFYSVNNFYKFSAADSSSFGASAFISAVSSAPSSVFSTISVSQQVSFSSASLPHIEHLCIVFYFFTQFYNSSSRLLLLIFKVTNLFQFVNYLQINRPYVRIGAREKKDGILTILILLRRAEK